MEPVYVRSFVNRYTECSNEIVLESCNISLLKVPNGHLEIVDL